MAAIYLDYNATTPIDPAVLDEMLPYLREHFGNPSSTHGYGKCAHDALDRARKTLTAHSMRIAFGAPPMGFVGAMLANEFVDALPVHRVRVSGGTLQEEYVA